MADAEPKYVNLCAVMDPSRDFRVFKDMVARLCKEREVGPGLGLQSAVKKLCTSGLSSRSWRRLSAFSN